MRATLLCLVVTVAGCSSSSNGSSPDAGSGAHPDGAVTHVDGAVGSPDANLDAPTDVPFIACTGTSADVYAATASATAPLGTVLACAPDAVMAIADVQTAIGSNMTATSAVAQFQIAFQTRDSAGGPAVSTARVYLPSTPRARPVPVVSVGHGSVGLADSCAPSTGADDNLPLPYAGRGFAVIAPDLAGLGNAGTQDYLDNRVQGHQLLDGIRALRALLAPGITADTVMLAGYSQGGGAALSAQALFRGDGAGLGTLAATVVYAPEWPIRMNSFQYMDILTGANQLVVQTGLSFSSVMVYRAYAFFEDHIGVGTGKTTVPASFQSGLESVIQSQCLVEVGGYIEADMLHTDNLMDPTLKTDFLACVNNSGTGATCTGDANALAYYNFLQGNYLNADPMAGPILMVQGLADQIMLPKTEAACIHDKLTAETVDVSTCVFLSADHTNIMNQHASGEGWAESVLAGGPRAVCDQTYALPTCTP